MSKLTQLIQVFNEDASELDVEAISHTAFIVCEIINKRKTILRGLEFQAYFYSSEFLELLFKNLYRHTTLTTHLSLILNALLQIIIQVSL